MNAATASRLISSAAEAIGDAADRLSNLDALTGDGDHGVNMSAAFTTARSRIAQHTVATPGEVFSIMADSFLDTVGGAAGALFGSFFKAMAAEMGDRHDPKVEHFAAGVERGMQRVMKLGRAAPGDKTMLDALAPAVTCARDLVEDGADLDAVLAGCAIAARRGADATAGMRPAAGRARFAGAEANGKPDPGACTVALMFEAWASVEQESS